MALLRYTAADAAVSLAATAALAACAGVRFADLRTPLPVPSGSCVVVGILGGMDAWDDADKGVRRLALAMHDPDRRVYVETFENRRTGIAAGFVRRALDTDDDDAVPAAEAARTRLVVYGQSLGGGAAVALARRLAMLGTPVDLLVLVDSVGVLDGEIPPNVRLAVNLYQDDGLFVRGQHPIRAVDPTATLVAEREFEYDRPPGSAISLADLAWHETAFRAAHARMDADPRIWSTVERLVRSTCESRSG